MSRLLLLVTMVCVTGGSTRAQSVAVQGTSGTDGKPIPIWTGVAPGSEGWKQKEVESRLLDQVMVRNVTTPTLTLFLPDKATATGTAVIVCPGGGFRFLTWENEGTELAKWLQKRGVAAFVLKYRLKETPARDEDFQKELFAMFMGLSKFKDRDPKSVSDKAAEKDGQAEMKAAFADGRQAIKLVRERAKEWGIKPDRIGIMGFSAGGMVTRAAATDYDDAASRPDFAAPIYAPVLEEVKVPKDAPPLFILCASDDQLAEASSARLYGAWRAAGRPAELHLYEKGGHGFGMTKKGLPVDGWTERFGDWLVQRGLIKPGQ
jgi:acetyl esterase/lipase